jgi:phage tail protein X
MQIRANQGDTVDTLCWRHLGSTDPVEAVLELNPGLAALGPIIPMGAAVTLPEIDQAAAQPQQTIQLWD